MRRQLKTVIIILLAVLLAAVIFCVIKFWYPHHETASNFSDEPQVILRQLQDGVLEISWPEARDADRYLFEILIPGDDGSYQPEYMGYVSGKTSHTVYNLPTDSPRTIRISVVKEYGIPFSDAPQQKISGDPIVITDLFCPPQIQHISWIPDPDTDTVSIALTPDTGCTARLYKISQSGESEPVETLESGKTTLYFGAEKNWSIPSYTQPYAFTFDAYRQAEGYIYYGMQTDPITLTRQDLLGTTLYLNSTSEAENRFTLSWNEAKGDYYILQHRASEDAPWQTLTEIPASRERSYTTQTLSPYSRYEYRVITRREYGTLENAPVSQSEPLCVTTQSKLIYSTVWPIQELTVYADADGNRELGKVKEGTAFCVLALENGKFRVRYQNREGYIDSNYCMINLPEFLGTLCSYDITNSYNSLYKIHEYDIPDVTGKVIAGYEQIRLAQDSYLVPLLYPTALKLEQAALAAKAEGCTIKIYDSFRPLATTQALYEQTKTFIDKTIPEDKLPEDCTPSESGDSSYTYAMYMTDNGRYALSFFLAKERSRHNQGIAIDMTLETPSGELPMQTDMHDLSWYSETAQNQSNADTMARIMKDAGFGTLISEWWHFQDNEAYDTLNIPALMCGVTPECWMADENGWRYRCANGKYYTDCTKTIDSQQYTFDQYGYIKN